MSVQTSKMWCLQGARCLGLRNDGYEASNLSKQVEGGWAGKGRDEVERARDGSKEEERERVHWALTVFASKSVHFSQENLARSGGG